MPETTTVEQTAPQGPNLTIADLVLTAQIIQAAATKGVFRAEELKVVGDYYERLVSFLESSGAITRTPPAPAEAAPADETATKEKANAKTRRKA
jgi:hypothetical protein